MPVPLCQLPSSAGTSVVTTTPSSVMCVVTFLAAAPFVSTVDIDSCGAESQAASSGFAAGEGEDARHFWGGVGFRSVLVTSCGSVVCSFAAAGYSSDCGLNSLTPSSYRGDIGRVFSPLNRFFIPVVVPSLAWVLAGSCLVPAPSARGSLPVPGPHLPPGPLLPLPVRGRRSPRFYSWQFLVEKVMGGTGGPSSIYQLSMASDRSVCVGVYQEGGLVVFDRPQRHELPDFCLSGISAISSVLFRGTCLSVLCPAGVHQSFCSGFGVG